MISVGIGIYLAWSGSNDVILLLQTRKAERGCAGGRREWSLAIVQVVF